MISLQELWLFVAAALTLVLIPGPNMIYIVSRVLSQGRMAGLFSLFGVACGYLVHVVAAALGLSVLLQTFPLAFWMLKLIGVGYLFWMAWQALGTGRGSMACHLVVDSHATLFRRGLLTNILNPKVAIFYVSLFPQFIDMTRGSVVTQSVELGLIQVLVSFVVYLLIIMLAGSMFVFLASRPYWLRVHRRVMGLVFASLAVLLVF